MRTHAAFAKRSRTVSLCVTEACGRVAGRSEGRAVRERMASGAARRRRESLRPMLPRFSFGFAWTYGIRAVAYARREAERRTSERLCSSFGFARARAGICSRNSTHRDVGSARWRRERQWTRHSTKIAAHLKDVWPVSGTPAIAPALPVYRPSMVMPAIAPALQAFGPSLDVKNLPRCRGRSSRKAGRGRGKERDRAAPFPSTYLEMSTSFVSGRKSVPITSVIAATMTGYHRPE